MATFWTEEEIALFDTNMTNAQIASYTGRTVRAVEIKRSLSRPPKINRPWTTKELSILNDIGIERKRRGDGRIKDAELAKIIGRTIGAVRLKRGELRAIKAERAMANQGA